MNGAIPRREDAVFCLLRRVWNFVDFSGIRNYNYVYGIR